MKLLAVHSVPLLWLVELQWRLTLWNICTQGPWNSASATFLLLVASLTRTVSPDYLVWSGSSSETRLVVLVNFYHFRMVRWEPSVWQRLCVASICAWIHSCLWAVSLLRWGWRPLRLLLDHIGLWGTDQYVVVRGLMESQLDCWKTLENGREPSGTHPDPVCHITCPALRNVLTTTSTPMSLCFYFWGELQTRAGIFWNYAENVPWWRYETIFDFGFFLSSFYTSKV